MGNQYLRMTEQLMQKIWMKKPNDHCQSQQLCCDKYPRAGHSWSLKTQTSKLESPLIPCKKIEKKKKMQIKLPSITDDIQSKSGQSWASNTKLTFKETNQPFCDKLITLHSFTMGTPDCMRSYSHFKEGIISFLFQQGQCFLTGSLRVILWGTTVVHVSWKKISLNHLQEKRCARGEYHRVRKFCTPKGFRGIWGFKIFWNIESEILTWYHQTSHISNQGSGWYARLSQVEYSTSSRTQLQLCAGSDAHFFCNTLKNKRTLVTAEGASWILYIDVQFSSVRFSRSVMRPHGLQHASLPCSSPAPRACSNSCPLNQWYHPTISSSAVPFFSCLQSFPASGSFPMSVLHIRWPKY